MKKRMSKRARVGVECWGGDELMGRGGMLI